VLLDAARRFGIMLGGIGAATVVASLGIGALAGYSLARSIAIGLYIVGSLLLIGGFFMGNRGPLRSTSSDGTSFGPFGPRGIRTATVDERHDAINSSALLVTLGLVLVLLGLASDPAHSLF
jgi:hypothetical protein